MGQLEETVRVILELRRTIARYRENFEGNEAQTRVSLIDPCCGRWDGTSVILTKSRLKPEGAQGCGLRVEGFSVWESIDDRGGKEAQQAFRRRA